MIKLALTDLDDTLIKGGLPRATDHALAAIHALLDAGLHFGPVSGRIPNDMSWMFAGQQECFATGAFCNGQMIYIDGELVHAESIDGEILSELAVYLTKTKISVLTMFDVWAGDITSAGYYVTDDPAHAERMMADFSLAKRCVDHLDQPSYLKANIHVAGNLAVRTQLRDQLRLDFPTLDFVFPSPHAPLIDISPHGWDKGSAVGVLAEKLGITLDEIAVFGDSENDLAMMQAVPHAVAVANASEQIARAASWHIGASADDAVADALFDIAAAAATGDMPRFMQGQR